MGLCDAVHDCQPQSRASLFRCEEWIENPPENLFGQAGAAVLNGKTDRSAFALGNQSQRSAIGHRIDGVEHKVQQCPADHLPVTAG